jgi:23S rRNA pseudouridine1911/1915/1917 synthase
MKFVYGEDEPAGRLDYLVAENSDGQFTRSTVGKLIGQGKVLVNGEVEKQKSRKLKPGDEIEVNYFPLELSSEVEVLFETDNEIVINKPAGMLSHAKGKLVEEISVAHWLYPKTSDLDEQRSGIVHRLDRATSGVMICAKNPEAKSWLMKQFSNRNVHKKYLAIIEGAPELDKFKIDMPIGRNPKKLTTFYVTDSGRSAETEVEVLSTNGEQSLVLLTPKTGRTHQLRVHMWANGWPIVGDPFYNPEFRQGEELMLHAFSLTIQTFDRKWKDFSAPLPDYIKYKLKELSLKYKT